MAEQFKEVKSKLDEKADIIHNSMPCLMDISSILTY